MAVERRVKFAIAAIYCLYYVAIAIALPINESWILVGLAVSHLIVGAVSAALDTDGPIAASRARYSVSQTGNAALTAITADLLLFTSLVASSTHASQQHKTTSLFYVGWVAAFLGNTACLVTHWLGLSLGSKPPTTPPTPLNTQLIP